MRHAGAAFLPANALSPEGGRSCHFGEEDPTLWSLLQCRASPRQRPRRTGNPSHQETRRALSARIRSSERKIEQSDHVRSGPQRSDCVSPTMFGRFTNPSLTRRFRNPGPIRRVHTRPPRRHAGGAERKPEGCCEKSWFSRKWASLSYTLCGALNCPLCELDPYGRLGGRAFVYD